MVSSLGQDELTVILSFVRGADSLSCSLVCRFFHQSLGVARIDHLKDMLAGFVCRHFGISWDWRTRTILPIVSILQEADARFHYVPTRNAIPPLPNAISGVSRRHMALPVMDAVYDLKMDFLPVKYAKEKMLMVEECLRAVDSALSPRWWVGEHRKVSFVMHTFHPRVSMVVEGVVCISAFHYRANFRRECTNERVCFQWRRIRMVDSALSE